MENKRETLDERQARLEAVRREQLSRKRRIRIAIIKYALLILPCLIAVLPLIFSFNMMRTVAFMERDVSNIKANRGENAILLNDSAGINGISNISDYINVSSDADEDLVPDGSRVYLTFDDGPSLYTDEILDILDKYDAKACFFVVGTEGFDSELQRIVKDGHTIGVHSFTHNYAKIYSSEKAFKKDVQLMSDKIFVTTGVRTKLYRFPGGSGNTVSRVSIKKLIDWLDEEEYTYYDWNALTGDAVAETIPPKELIANAMGYIRSNHDAGKATILLMHDHSDKHNMVDALDDLLAKLKKEGYLISRPLDENVPPVQQIPSQDKNNS